MSSLQYVFGALKKLVVVSSKWLEQQIIGGNRSRGPRWNAKTINNSDKEIYCIFKGCIKESCVTGTCETICADLHSNVFTKFENKFTKLHNNKKVIKFITTNGFRPSAPTRKMKHDLDKAFHHQFDHMIHHETLMQLKQKAEQIFDQYKHRTDCEVLVVAYMIINSHLNSLSNLRYAKDWNQYHVEFMALQFINPNYAIPLFLEPNGKYTLPDAKSISLYYTYIYIYIYIYDI